MLDCGGEIFVVQILQCVDLATGEPLDMERGLPKKIKVTPSDAEFHRLLEEVCFASLIMSTHSVKVMTSKKKLFLQDAMMLRMHYVLEARMEMR